MPFRVSEAPIILPVSVALPAPRSRSSFLDGIRPPRAPRGSTVSASPRWLRCVSPQGRRLALCSQSDEEQRSSHDRAGIVSRAELGATQASAAGSWLPAPPHPTSSPACCSDNSATLDGHVWNLDPDLRSAGLVAGFRGWYRKA